jgi:hypothetical protein
MEPGLTRKLAIAAGAVAAFFGFVALTGWTSSGELDEQDKRDLGTFCYVMSLSSDYEAMLRTAVMPGGQDVLGGGGAIDNGFSSFIENTLLEHAPETYRDDASHVVQGLERGLQGELTPDEVDAYIDDFHRLEDRSSGDCEQFDDEPPDFGGGGEGGPFGFGGGGGD